MNINTHELAWSAGFFDGEGSTSFAKYKHGYGIRLSVGQSKEYAIRLLERFKSAVGKGEIYGPWINPKRPHHAPSWEWKCAKFEDAQSVIALLWNFLGPAKRAQARAALIKYNNWYHDPATKHIFNRPKHGRVKSQGHVK